MRHIISDFLKNLHEADQRDRRRIIAEQQTSKLSEAGNAIPFHLFKGATDERVRIVMYLIEHDALQKKNDYYHAAALLVNAGDVNCFIAAYRLMKHHRDLGGSRPWKFHDTYFTRQHWGKRREEVEALIQQAIGVHPSTIDRE